MSETWAVERGCEPTEAEIRERLRGVPLSERSDPPTKTALLRQIGLDHLTGAQRRRAVVLIQGLWPGVLIWRLARMEAEAARMEAEADEEHYRYVDALRGRGAAEDQLRDERALTAARLEEVAAARAERDAARLEADEHQREAARLAEELAATRQASETCSRQHRVLTGAWLTAQQALDSARQEAADLRDTHLGSAALIERLEADVERLVSERDAANLAVLAAWERGSEIGEALRSTMQDRDAANQALASLRTRIATVELLEEDTQARLRLVQASCDRWEQVAALLGVLLVGASVIAVLAAMGGGL